MPVEATHNDNIEVSITQAPLPVGDQKFQTIAYMKDGITLNGARVTTYASPDAVAADEALGYVDAATTAAVSAALAQPNVRQVKVIKVDTVGLETYPDALDLGLAVDSEFWAIVLDVRTDAIAVAVAAHLDSLANVSDGFRGLLVAQSSAADWLTSGIPAAFSSVSSSERLAVVYHDTDGELDDIRWAANRAVWNPDDRCAPWDGEIEGGSNIAALTDAQKGFLDGNYANHALPFGAIDRWVDGGWVISGAFVYESLTTDWYQVRLSQDIATAKATYSARGRKWPMDDVGRAAFGSLISKRFRLGIAAEHFKDGQVTVTVEPLTSTDLSLGRIRASGAATYLGSARQFRVDLVFGREDVNPAA